MTLTGYKTYSATAAEVAALPCFYAAVRQWGQYQVPDGDYRGRSVDGSMSPMVVSVRRDYRGDAQEVWSRIRIVESEAA